MDIMDYELQLTDLIDLETLQKIQDAYSETSDIAVITTNADGVAVTEGSNFCEFCKYTRASSIGRVRCEQCNKNGASIALRKGTSIVYSCHAGLMDFVAPIMVNGRQVGCFIGGQILTSPVEEQQIRTIASEIGVDAEEYIAAGKKVAVMEQEKVEKAAKSLFTIANILSDMAYRRYLVHKSNVQLEQSETMKSDFLANMSHEIRTPMNAIIGMTEIAQRNIQDPGRVSDCLKKVRLSSKHLLGLINDVLDMSKIESRKMTLNMAPVSLRDTMDDLVNIIQPQIKAKKQHFDIFIQNICSEGVFCDDVRLNQALINILSNAVKYTPEEGNIYIYLDQEQSALGETYVRTNFYVVDSGIGMSSEFLEKIWDTFSREETDQVRHILGTGLGMSITKSLVDLMGGTIEVESELGKGSTFCITLDLMKAEGKDLTQMELPAWNVLVVDDDEQLCSSAVSNLESLGVQCEWALSGVQAVSMVRERHAQGKDYDFVLIDWKMPGQNGIQTIHMIREEISTQLPIFLMSADDLGEMEEEASKAGIEGFIAKPLFASRLYERLRKYVDGYEEQPEPADSKKEDITFEGRKVLLAEDMEINWEVANEILSSTGMQLEHAEDGRECLKMFEASEPGYYDAVLMDIRMPGMDGYEAAQAIRALDRPDRSIPIIAMTADAFAGDIQKCLDAGMDDHIAKPLDIGECMRVLQNHLG